ncbi:YisL family protein [Bacillus canaveralius]|uniref:YisL family protein n=1 Tax=Bacillus canaveralius TaxID=1403243 RepID=UPI000F7B119B|nr:YisL family protein [Bacillus canaveralius]RSK46921.1 DUF1516 family protein [Bacillus canaveralius]
MTTHFHITVWFLALVLFFVALGLHKSGNQKGSKIVHMILRVLYLLIIATGAEFLFRIENVTLAYILKTAVGLWVIAMLEMILIRTKKQKKTSILWGQFIVALVLVLYLGLSLPIGFDWF